MTARVVCCVCQKDMGVKEGFDRPGLVSHGLCSKCVNEQMKEYGVWPARREDALHLRGECLRLLSLEDEEARPGGGAASLQERHAACQEEDSKWRDG